MEIEKRSINEPIQYRQEDNKAVFYGYAMKFDSPSPVRFGWYEVIDRSALTQEIIDKSDIRALFNHDANLVLARKGIDTPDKDTLRLKLDDTGLYYEFDDPGTQLSADLKKHMELGNIDQSSFAFTLQPEGDKLEEDDQGLIKRTITAFKELYDVSPVTYAFYPQANSGVKSRIDEFKAELEAKTAENDEEIDEKDPENQPNIDENQPEVEENMTELPTELGDEDQIPVETNEYIQEEKEENTENTEENIVENDEYLRFLEIEKARY